MTRRIRPTLLALLVMYTVTAACPARADAMESLWQYATLYTSTDGWLRDLSLSGRLQADASYFDARQGEFDDLGWRRFRFGFTADFAGHWKAQLEGDFDLNAWPPADWYNRLTDAYIGWQPDRARDLRILKHSAGFTLDGATSSKKLLTLQRNNLTNNLWFTAEYFTGISMKGALDNHWQYRVGVFSSDGSEQWSRFDASYFTLASAGYNWAAALDMDKAVVRLDYVYNQRDAEANTRDLSNVVTLSTQWEQGRWGLWTDLGAGRGYFQQPDLRGLTLMPFYTLGDTLQLLFRYTWLDSDGDNGIRAGRYENRIVDGRGDRYEEFYVGANLFFYGHKLKWQTGLQHTTMDDRAGDGGEYRGWGVTTGLRIYW